MTAQNTLTWKAGDRVMGGDNPEDFDTGTIRELNTENAVVAWDSGVTTATPLSTLQPYDAEHAHTMRAWLAD